MFLFEIQIKIKLTSLWIIGEVLYVLTQEFSLKNCFQLREHFLFNSNQIVYILWTNVFYGRKYVCDTKNDDFLHYISGSRADIKAKTEMRAVLCRQYWSDQPPNETAQNCPPGQCVTLSDEEMPLRCHTIYVIFLLNVIFVNMSITRRSYI